MADLPTNNDPKAWHRYFAVECNNRAWELAAGSRDAARDREMLDTAHASVLHWEAIGTELNRMRARMLLAEVHALLGYGSSALRYAEEVRDYFVNTDTADWELAFTHTIHAHAAYVAGETEAYRTAHAAATKALDAVADAEDRKIVRETYDQVPAP